MSNFICTTCGTEYAESETPPAACAICDDERQYVKPSGQQWTTLENLQRSHRLAIRALEPGLVGIGIEPQFGIGQRAILVRTESGNFLWDCVSLVDEAVVDAIKAWGGLDGIAISHPHYYSSMVRWSRAFGGVPIYLHHDDREWVKRPDDAILFWDGETKGLRDGLTLVRCGGHFPGGAVLHWNAAADGRSVLLSGDIIQVVADRKSVSFMYSFPNFIPLGRSAVLRIVEAVRPFPSERIYGAFWESVINSDGRGVIVRSAERYLRAIAS